MRRAASRVGIPFSPRSGRRGRWRACSNVRDHALSASRPVRGPIMVRRNAETTVRCIL